MINLFSKKCTFILLVTLSMLFLGHKQANAATIYFQSDQKFPVLANAEFEVTVFINSSEELINAVEGELVFDDEHLELVGIRDGSSVVTSWIERPKANGSSVKFSGIMVGGFGGTINPLDQTYLDGKLFSAIFTTKSISTSELYLTTGQAYFNDGLGTKAPTLLYPFRVISSETGEVGTNFASDIERPLVFYPQISSNQYIFDGKYFLIFSTTDKESGISRFEVKEGNSDWKVAESPYLLEDQSMRSLVRVKAIDNAGNVRIAQIHSEQFFPVSILVIPLLIVTAIFAFVIFFVPRKFKKIKVQ